MQLTQIEFDNLDAIIFDLGGVILNLDYELTIDAFKKLGKKNFDQLYTQANQDKIFDQFEVGAINPDEFVAYIKQFLSQNIKNQDIVDAWNALLLDLPIERINCVSKLRELKKVFLFSNTNDLHYKSFKQKLKVNFDNSNLLEETFDETYFSHLAGVRKPNKEAFELVMQDHGLDPSKTLFIDDSIQHIEGANKLGIQTIHLLNTDICKIFEKVLK